MQIQWYPGHMAKARRLLIEDLKFVDVVCELVDARAPLSTRNPDFDVLFSGKARVVLMNKSDLADAAASRAWIEAYKKQGVAAAAIDATKPVAKTISTALIAAAADEKVQRMREKGVTKVVRAMIVGIPNVGKSTLINRIAGGKRAAVGDKPGVTKSKQWVKITPYLELMDTPGLLWPKLEDQGRARNLAFIGSINDEIMPVEALASSLLFELRGRNPAGVCGRYEKLSPETPEEQLLSAVCASRGFLLPGGEADTERAARIVLDEFRAGRLGRVTLDAPEADR